MAEPIEQPSGVLLSHAPAGHAPLERLQVVSLVPPPEPLHAHVRVVPQAVRPLSLPAVPVVQPSATALLHAPLTGHAVLAKEQVPELVPPPEPLQTH